ncbi:hypothetical protein LWC34_52780 [Kibdelosporangium philippinense]|uniref:Uncharacterized protein n=1 Tax=Kibdelosporangium philippinense TaxID=211113 RepID=A0ABS8ZXY2_9PSEU|nr:hypothetical protein [Kibdelosporangium philippinense]MCE7011433.1 hypothetical protein [Kibdelosporangium philippinense]
MLDIRDGGAGRGDPAALLAGLGAFDLVFGRRALRRARRRPAVPGDSTTKLSATASASETDNLLRITQGLLGSGRPQDLAVARRCAPSVARGQ